jgi:glycosyltransferase involved in cell wall biosynthesis
MDGKSTDNTLKIIERYDRIIHSKKFKPKCRKIIFRWFSEKDKGQSHAINKALKIAKGDIVNWLCSDDILEEGALGKINDFFIKNKEANVVFGLSKGIDEEGKPFKKPEARSFTRSELIRRWNGVYHKFVIPQSSTFLRKNIINEAGYIDENNHLCMDYDLYLRINKKYKFFFINEIISRDRNHKNCKSSLYQKQQYIDSLSVSKRYWRENYLYYSASFIINAVSQKLYKISESLKKRSKAYRKLVKIIKN